MVDQVDTSSRPPGELALKRLLSLSAETLIAEHMNEFLMPLSLAVKRLIELHTSGHSTPWKKREWMVSSQAIPPNWERTVSSSLTLPPDLKSLQSTHFVTSSRSAASWLMASM